MNKYTSVLVRALTGLNVFEVVLLTAMLALVAVGFASAEAVSWNMAIAATSAVLGVFCVVLGAKGAMANWLFGIVEALLHIYICFCTHIYGDMLQRLLYNLPMQFVGWHKWRKRELKDGSARIRTRYMTWPQRLYTLLSVVAGTALLGWFLTEFGPWFVTSVTELVPGMEFKTFKTAYDQPLQLWLDSFTTVMSIITMWVSVKAFCEQWYMWLAINVAYIAMWLMSDSEFSFMTVAKYSIYFINSFYGIYAWNKLSKKQ